MTPTGFSGFRRFAVLLPVIGLLTACARGPGRGVAPPPAPSPSGVAAAEMRAEPQLRVKLSRGTRMRTGPGPWHITLRDVSADEDFTYLGNRAGWVQVRTDRGEIGYLPAADVGLTDAADRPVAYWLGAGGWAITADDGPKVELSRSAPGVMRVAVQAPGQLKVAAAGTDSLFIPALTRSPRAALDVGDSGVGRVSLTEQGVLLDLEGGSLHRVVSAGEGRLELEIRPGVSAVTALPQDGGWRLAVRGVLRPQLRREGGELILDLPGALPALEGTRLPGAVKLDELGAEGLRFRVPAPEGPAALYRPQPGVLELRFLAPGVKGKTIVIDPGHGGAESGAAGPGGSLEKEITLAVALKLKPLLEQAGARVILTRTADARVLPDPPGVSGPEQIQHDLTARSALSIREGADLYLSIHGNGGQPADGGTETFWADVNLNAEASRRLATLAQEELLSALGLVDRGVKHRYFSVIALTEAPATLVELGFVTNPAEERLLTSAEGQQSAARALARAAERYFTERP